MNGSSLTLISRIGSIFLLVLFFGWGTGGKVWTPFTIYFPTFHLVLLACLLAAFLAPVQRAAGLVWEWLTRSRRWFFPLFAFVATLLIHLLVFQGLPHIQDSIHYRMMADWFAAGELDLPMHPYYEFFRYLYLIPDGERIYSLFLPGYSLFLVPFVRIGAPFLANPLLTAANVALLGRTAEDFFGPRIATTTMALACVSTFLMVMGGTAMAHSFCAFLTLLAVFLFLRARAASTGRRALILSGAAGFLVGWLVFTRPQNALFLAIPLGLAALVEIRRSGTIPRGLAFTLGIAPWLVALFLYNVHYTGDPLLFKQDPYFNYSEPNDFCHRFGIGRGCPHSNWTVLPEEGLTWTHALYVTFRRLSPLLVNTFPHPLFFLLIPFVFWFGNAAVRRKAAFFTMIFLSTVVGYFFFYFDGNVFGPRYYYETASYLPLLAALGIEVLGEQIRRLPRQKFIITPLTGLAAAGIVFTLLFVLPPLFARYAKGFWGVEKSLSETIEKMGITNAVVFVSDEELIGSGFAEMRHDDWDKNAVIYVRDLGDRANSALMHYYHGRRFFRARYAKLQANDDPPVVTPLAEPELPPTYLVTEMEDKRYPLRGEPDYCNEYPGRADLFRYIAIPHPVQLGIDFSKKGFFCRFRDPDEFYTFGQNFLAAGHYRITFVGVAGPVMGRFRLFADDHLVGTLDFTGTVYEKATRTLDLDLTAGFHLFRIEPEESSRESYFLLDFIEWHTEEYPS